MELKSNSSNMWPYVIAGSAIGGAIGYLCMTESGRKIRHTIAHPRELADGLDDARCFIEEKTRAMTGQVRNVLDKAKQGLMRDRTRIPKPRLVITCGFGNWKERTPRLRPTFTRQSTASPERRAQWKKASSIR